MTSKAPLHDDLPAPMLAADALRLKSRKSAAKMSPSLADKLSDQPPKMQEFDGRHYPAGPETVEVAALKGSKLDEARAVETEAHIPEYWIDCPVLKQRVNEIMQLAFAAMENKQVLVVGDKGSEGAMMIRGMLISSLGVCPSLCLQTTTHPFSLT